MNNSTPMECRKMKKSQGERESNYFVFHDDDNPAVRSDNVPSLKSRPNIKNEIFGMQCEKINCPLSAAENWSPPSLRSGEAVKFMNRLDKTITLYNEVNKDYLQLMNNLSSKIYTSTILQKNNAIFNDFFYYDNINIFHKNIKKYNKNINRIIRLYEKYFDNWKIAGRSRNDRRLKILRSVTKENCIIDSRNKSMGQPVKENCYQKECRKIIDEDDAMTTLTDEYITTSSSECDGSENIVKNNGSIETVAGYTDQFIGMECRKNEPKKDSPVSESRENSAENVYLPSLCYDIPPPVTVNRSSPPEPNVQVASEIPAITGVNDPPSLSEERPDTSRNTRQRIVHRSSSINQTIATLLYPLLNFPSQTTENRNSVSVDRRNSIRRNTPKISLETFNEKVEYVNYNQDMNNNENRCPISLEDFQSNEIVCRIKNCSHIFKTIPLINWMKINTICPVCRYDLISIDENRETGNDISDRTINWFSEEGDQWVSQILRSEPQYYYRSSPSSHVTDNFPSLPPGEAVNIPNNSELVNEMDLIFIYQT
jgi:hypothetical protein